MPLLILNKEIENTKINFFQLFTLDIWDEDQIKDFSTM